MSLISKNIRLTPSEKNLIRRALILLVGFTVITIITGLGAMMYTRRHQPMIVPRIIGMDQDQAEKALASKSLRLKITHSQYDEHMPEGLIVIQSKRANDYVKRGEIIEAILSKGSPKVKVPAIVNLSFPQAQITLTGNRLRVGRESLVASPLAPKDMVIAQVPSPDELVDSFTEVNLLVSTGPTDPAFVMPNLKNQPLEQAFKALRPAGITIEKIKSEVHDDLDSETLLAQSPPAGTKIQKKDSVSLVVSAKSSDSNLKGRYAKIDFDMPEGNPRRLQIDVFDSSGTQTIYNKMESPKDHVELGVSVTGKASAQVYLNQEFVKEIPIP
jgi:beta-lactam-binding protein with PASTA domain